MIFDEEDDERMSGLFIPVFVAGSAFWAYDLIKNCK